MKKSHIAMIAAFLIGVGMLGKAFTMDEDIKMYLLMFWGIGIALAFLRIFVNNSIKKMKGKNWKVKVVFFAVLLGFGLPFQSWFRNAVLFNMDSAYLGGSILMLVVGMVFMTFFSGYAKEKFLARKTQNTQAVLKS
ncbi:MFS transporter permease [Planococcus sp. NCCP-2050]|uniref:MFS transporter permease n=1 Tax=Planococcus sp. NCCP-2050 TaxID=2944679 RepID=UPI002041F313|nr:MFS transporter permease [Planococcus sp. NCCP-2050]GKW47129.1 hypothetical protein NCCP2050_28210 [Planococcus sp. NCCP-2050]